MAHLLIRKEYYTVGSECEAWLWCVNYKGRLWCVNCEGYKTFSVFGRSDLVSLGLAKVFKGPDGTPTSFNIADFYFIRNWIM